MSESIVFRKAIALTIAIGLSTGLVIYGLVPSLHALLLHRTERILQTHFQSTAVFSDFRIFLFPRFHVTITELVLRHNGRMDIPSLVQVRQVSMYAGMLSLLRSKPRIDFVQLDGLQIHMPPRQPGGEPLIRRTDQNLAEKYPVFIREIRADDAILVILGAQPGKPSRVFLIHQLQLRNVSFDRPAEFHAMLRNAVPEGEIDARGEFGPWLPKTPSETPATGHFLFRNVDLGTLKGIQGTLSSKGSFTGPLDYLEVNGTTDTPNFSLRLTDHPMALHTDFSCIVDGTNGDTYLKRVTARFWNTTLAVSGKIVDVNRNVKGRTIVLYAVSQDARMEDLIRLAVQGN